MRTMNTFVKQNWMMLLIGFILLITGSFMEMITYEIGKYKIPTNIVQACGAISFLAPFLGAGWNLWKNRKKKK